MNFTANFYTIKGIPVELEMSTGSGKEKDEELDSKAKIISGLLAQFASTQKLEKKAVYFFDGEFSLKGGKLEAKEFTFEKTEFTTSEFKSLDNKLKNSDGRELAKPDMTCFYNDVGEKIDADGNAWKIQEEENE